MTSLARHNDPIVAIATAPGRGAVGIVRASGRDLSMLIAAVCAKPLTPRMVHYGPIRDAHGEPLDQGLAIHFPAPNSYTGEDVLELQAHGGPVVLQLILARCLEAGRSIGLRVANPGEFTARAFLNDKLDLAQAEAVADLIDASTEAAARSAGRSLAGAFSKEITALGERIVHLRMLVEATLDFPEEEIDFLERAGALQQLADIRTQLDAVMARARQGALLREGQRVVLAGAPNVGKSSLLNALAGAELAIVTPIAGTTRDRITETIQIHGVPVHVIDTAGLREASDEVEKVGIARSWQAIADADAVLFLHDLSRADDPQAQADDAAIAADLAHAHAAEPLHVFNKRDLAPDHPLPPGALALSAQTGAGLDALRDALLERAGATHVPDGVFIARTRHVEALARTGEHLQLARLHADQRDAALDLFAEELRLAHGALGEITGQFTADDLLGEIFGRFCIGK
jgi:tRNA modification GTPase